MNGPLGYDEDVQIGSALALRLAGHLSVPELPVGVVTLVEGADASRNLPGLGYVTDRLHERGLATLHVDLLTAAEVASLAWSRGVSFGVSLLADRISVALQWLELQSPVPQLPIGLLGSGATAAACLLEAVKESDRVSAVVGRGAELDVIADAVLGRVLAPTLLIVGGEDRQSIVTNDAAVKALRGPGELQIVPGAAQLLEESFAVPQVAALAAEWFDRYLSAASGVWAPTVW